jgi:hypothetical protein
MQEILTPYTIPPAAQVLISKFQLRVSNISVDYEQVERSAYATKIFFGCRLYSNDAMVCDFHIKWSTGNAFVYVKHASDENLTLLTVINGLCEHYEESWPFPETEYTNLGGLIVIMIKKLFFDNACRQLKANHILRTYTDDQWSSIPWYPLDFIPRRYNSKPFSNMSPAERRKWHIKTVFNKIAIYNPEIFTLYKMRDENK